MEFLIFALLALAISAAIGAWVASEKGRDPIEGGVVGFFLGPVGWILEGLLPVGAFEPGPATTPATPVRPPISLQRAVKRCPDCAQDVFAEARLCHWCRYTFPTPAEAPTTTTTPATMEAQGAAPVVAEMPLALPAGQWRIQRDWSPNGRYLIEGVAPRREIPVSFGWIMEKGATLRARPQGDGTWVELDSGTAALVSPEDDQVSWVTCPTDSLRRVVLVTRTGQPLLILSPAR